MDRKRIRKKSNQTKNENITAYLMLLPTIIIFLIFLYIPFANALRIGFFNWNGLGELTDFVGFSNYTSILQDPKFYRSLWNTLVLLMSGVVVAIPLGFLLAYMLFLGIPGKKIFNTMLFIPYLISMVVVGNIWRIIYDPSIGLLNGILNVFGLEQFAVAWLSRLDTSLFAIAVAWIWRSTPFNMLIMYANILKLPTEIIEASEIDGAGNFQRLRYVIIPYLYSTFGVLFILAVTNGLRIFDLIWVMTKGGPGGATEVITSYIYRNVFLTNKYGRGTAASILMMILMILIMVAQTVIPALYQKVSGKKKVVD